VYKLVYGRPFRNPSAFEQFYSDGGLSYVAAPLLRPEVADTFEASLEHQLTRSLALVLNGFHYRIDRVIDAVVLPDGALQYRNTGRLRSTGIEMELSGKLWDRVELSASTVVQETARGAPAEELDNSPNQLPKFRIGVPLVRNHIFLSATAQYTSSRLTAGADRVGGFPLAGFTATIRLHPKFDLITGVRNAFDRHYEDPVYLCVDRLRGDGRSVFLKLVWRVWE
jgi:iron complex outermembrane receptor protein